MTHLVVNEYDDIGIQVNNERLVADKQVNQAQFTKNINNSSLNTPLIITKAQSLKKPFDTKTIKIQTKSDEMLLKYGNYSTKSRLQPDGSTEFGKYSYSGSKEFKYHNSKFEKEIMSKKLQSISYQNTNYERLKNSFKGANG